ncbi:flavin monoamine oxidase family protein [Bordetella petrii]|uniref:flavin monoamine oxidase family protein n=1 Tax=Bordetella petrii TaxID=94624 RepID=UPI0005A46B68|nr:FAD-dependent oxidoreductase [Bordetella petrii]
MLVERVRAQPADLGRGRSVAVVGAGIAGLVTAYELARLGFDVSVLEAGSKAGGRIKTLRAGDSLCYDDGTVQHAGFASDLYFNAGAARIPSTHRALLGYCRELGVALEVISLISRSALCVVQEGGGDRRYTVGQLQGDARGLLSELLAKCASQGALNSQLDAEDRHKLLGLLRDFGDLRVDGSFAGSRRSGYAVSPAAGEVAGTLRDSLELRTLLDRRLWYPLWYDEHLEYQPTMMQPIGGMDAISEAFARALGPRLLLGGTAIRIDNISDGARIVYQRDGAAGESVLQTDYAVVTCPLPVLSTLHNNLPSDFLRAAASIDYLPAYKIGWQSPRFWEERDGIYGGISFLDDDTSLVWYPSHGLFEPRGLLVGAYTHGAPAQRYADLPLAGQYEKSRRSLERLHPGQAEQLSQPMCVAWHKLSFSRGG